MIIEYNEQDIQEVMEITGLDKSKAEKLFKSVANDIDDGTDNEICSYDVIDVIKLESKAKENGADKMYIVGETQKQKRKPRERKVDEDKEFLMKAIGKSLNEFLAISCENESKIHFEYNGTSYTVTLTKHRPKK